MRLLGFVGISLAAVVSMSHGHESTNDAQKKELLESASVFLHRTDKLLEIRSLAGIDIRAEDFRKVDPAIFESSPNKVLEISRLSRMINYINFKIRENRVQSSVKYVLEGQDKTAQVHCPFQQQVTCSQTKYRTVDGTCNNLKQPLRGAALTPFVRELIPLYGAAAFGKDEYDLPRTKGRKSLLPGARDVSRAVHQTAPIRRQSNVSFFFTFWGQFIAHMVTERAIATGFNGTIINCCDQSKPTPAGECFNIPVPKVDPFRKRGTTCLGFLRSLEVTDVNCKGGREQLNTASSFIDGSAVYGTEKERAEFLRTHRGGQMAVSEPNQLPYRAHVNRIAAKSGFSFVTAGDPRAPEVSPLTGVHTIWVREHNRIARGLAAINPQWEDETLYQEARRIVVAMIQHVTYNEWLPILLGPKLYRRFNLKPAAKGFFTGYSPGVDASTSNAVATAAFRFGHSLAPSTFPLCDKRYQPTSPALSIVDMFFRPNVYLTNEQSLMRGLLARRAPAMDAFISPPLTSKLFQIRPDQNADLAALNIQRGRDHGLQPYNAWRAMFGLPEATRFTHGLTGFTDIPADTVQRLKSVYRDPQDVDLWTGGVSETPLEGAVLGPLFGNLLGRQFQRYKRGDRFWYETDLKPQAFTPEQLKEIRGTTFARVICNTYDVDTIQPKAFRIPTRNRNSRVECNTLPQIDLNFWKN